MKLSLWQQFSSNHSAAFSIVAKFESIEKAEQVRTQLTEMLLESYQWVELKSDTEMNPARIRHKFEHGTAFGLTWMLSEQHMKRAIQRTGDVLLIADDPGYSNFDGTDSAFLQLLQRLGAKVIGTQESGDLSSSMTLIGDAEDESAAEKILNHIIKVEYPNDGSCYRHDFNQSEPYESHAENVYRKGKQLIIEKVYLDLHFVALSSWYRFMEQHKLSNIQVRFLDERHNHELKIALPDTLRPLMWEKISWIRDTIEYPAIALAEFETVEEATSVAAKLREILQKIQAWIDANPEESLAIWEVFWDKLSPIEIELQQEYGLEWSESLVEWIHPSVRRHAADAIITQIGKTIYIANFKETWIGINPIDKLAEKLGAKVTGYSALHFSSFAFQIQIKAQLAESVKEIMEAIEHKNGKSSLAWLSQYKDYANAGAYHKDIEALQKHDAEARAYDEALSEFVDFHDKLQTQYNLTEFLQILYTPPELFTPEIKRIRGIMNDCELSYRAIQQDGRMIKIEGVRFQKAATMQGLEAFVKWLQAKGCEIELELLYQRGT